MRWMGRESIMMKEIEWKLQGKIKRLTNQTFKFDERVGEGWFFCGLLFLKTREIIQHTRPGTVVTMQFFSSGSMRFLCGTDEAIALLQTFAAHPEKLEVHSLKDGDKVSPFETVLTIRGPYEYFGYLEGVIDGILARRTSVATNVYNVVQAARSGSREKPIIFLWGGS
ncbi:hypothetical protein GCM10020331_031210 [Ectobacillus funiculus]